MVSPALPSWQAGTEVPVWPPWCPVMESPALPSWQAGTGVLSGHHGGQLWSHWLPVKTTRHWGPCLATMAASYGVPSLSVKAGRHGGQCLAKMAASCGVPWLVVMAGRHGHPCLATMAASYGVPWLAVMAERHGDPCLTNIAASYIAMPACRHGEQVRRPLPGHHGGQL
jgi:hypothetical protein